MIHESYMHILHMYLVPISTDYCGSSKDALRKEVENLFNQLYGMWNSYVLIIELIHLS